MKTKNTHSSNPFIRFVTLASLCAASLVLMAACQSSEDEPEAVDTEGLSALETSDDAADVGTAEGALLPMPETCDIRCCDHALYHVSANNERACRDTASSFCGGWWKVKRIQFGGRYIHGRPC